MKLVWSRFALSDRDGIFSYIEAENPRAAVHVDEQIANAARRLLDGYHIDWTQDALHSLCDRRPCNGGLDIGGCDRDNLSGL